MDHCGAIIFESKNIIKVEDDIFRECLTKTEYTDNGKFSGNTKRPMQQIIVRKIVIHSEAV